MSVDGEEVTERRLACEILVCLTDRCSHLIKTEKSQCPNGPEESAWNYSPYGLSDRIVTS